MENKTEIIDVYVPHHAFIKESEGSILIHIYGDQYVWVTKKFFRSYPGTIFNTYRLGIVPNWKYKVYCVTHTNIKDNWDVDKELTGTQLAEVLTAPHSYFRYNLPKKKW